jgi:hypothetical protein
MPLIQTYQDPTKQIKMDFTKFCNKLKLICICPVAGDWFAAAIFNQIG